MAKTRQQEAQEKRLQRNVRQSKKLRAETRKAGRNAAPKQKEPSKQGGFFVRFFGNPPQTVQQSIPYREMHRDGICRTSGRTYTKTIQFFDINYQLAQAEDKAQIFESYRSMEEDAHRLESDHTLTAELIERLIDRIEITHDHDIHVTFRFQSEFTEQRKAVPLCANT